MRRRENARFSIVIFQKLEDQESFRTSRQRFVLRPHLLSDPRDIAHDKKVQQEKKHDGEDISPDAEHTPQPGKNPPVKHEDTKDVAYVMDDA